MFDKIPSLKDFIIYFIPGALISYFTINILSILMPTLSILHTQDISGDSVLIFIGILFSFLVGFIFSQIQILIFNLFIYRKKSKILKIQFTNMSNELKERTAQKIIQVFSLTNIQSNVILQDSTLLHLCLNYVKAKSNDEINIFINRAGNLSSFASASTLPLILGIWNFVLKVEIPVTYQWIVMAIIATVIVLLTVKITINFRKEWINSVYEQFLIL